jgi:hypothetical protein
MAVMIIFARSLRGGRENVPQRGSESPTAIFMTAISRSERIRFISRKEHLRKG